MRVRRSLLLVFLLVGSVVAASGCSIGSGDDSAKELSKQEELRQAREDGESKARIRQLEKEVREKKQGGGGGTATAGGSSSSSGGNSSSAGGGGRQACGGDLSVGANTSCSFAGSVRDEFNRSGPGTIDAYSPATGRAYTMSCTATSPHVCTGGNNASVYFP